MSRKKSIELYHRALEIIPGGVNSPVRAFKAVGVPPTFIERAKGSKIFDVDSNEYIDYVGSWGQKSHPKGHELRCSYSPGSGTCQQSEEGLPLHGIGEDGEFWH
jgi:hypothetical protein